MTDRVDKITLIICITAMDLLLSLFVFSILSNYIVAASLMAGNFVLALCIFIHVQVGRL